MTEKKKGPGKGKRMVKLSPEELDAIMLEDDDTPREVKLNGRPTKYKEEYCALVVERAVTNKDDSLLDFACHLMVNKDSINEWRNRYPTFSVACKTARIFYERQFRKILKKQMTGQVQGSATATIFYLKAQHSWRDDIANEEDDSSVELDINIK